MKLFPSAFQGDVGRNSVKFLLVVEISKEEEYTD